MTTLRPYQQHAVAAALRFWREGRRRALIVLPTGCGKTLTAGSIVTHPGRKPGTRTLWIAHTGELLRQARDALVRLGGDVGVVDGREDNPERPIVCASIQTVSQIREGQLERLARVARAVSLVVVDEAHHAVAPTYRRVMEALPDARFLGLTATPARGDGTELGGVWEDVVYQLSIAHAARDGWLAPLAPPVVERVPDLDLGSLPVNAAGDYQAAALRVALLQSHVVEHTVAAILQHGQGRRGIVFCALVEQARETAVKLQRAGVRAGWVSGERPPAERAEVLAQLKRGELDWVCNCAVLTEGFDEPRVDAVVVARPTRSKTLYVQMVGRGTRLHPEKKDLLVIDLAGATEDHTLVTAPVVLAEDQDDDQEAPAEVEIPLEAAAEPATPISPLEGLLRRRPARERLAWVPLERGGSAIGTDNRGLILVVDEGEDGWGVWHRVTGDDRIGLVGLYPTEADALGHADDLARRCQAAKACAGWRRAPASDRARAACERWRRQLPEGATGGDASDAMTAAVARAALREVAAERTRLAIMGGGQ